MNNLVGCFEFLHLGDYFMGNYLCFRDAWSLAQTCHTTYKWMFESKTFLQYYIRQLVKRSASNIETFFDYFALCQVPICQNVDQLEYCRCVAYKRLNAHYLSVPQYIYSNHSYIPSEKGIHFALLNCLRHIKAAQIHISQGISQEEIEMFKLCPKQVEKFWGLHFSSILIQWAHGIVNPISQWKNNSRNHCVLRFLLHSFDIRESIWEFYLQDPRYLGFYQPKYFNGNDKCYPNFWNIISSWFEVHARYPLDLFSQAPIHFETPKKYLVSGMCRGADGFKFFYHYHLNLAQNLFLSRGPREHREEIYEKSNTLNKVCIVKNRKRICFEVFSTTEIYKAILVYYGIVPQPHLVAVVDVDNDIYPIQEEWQNWREIIFDVVK